MAKEEVNVTPVKKDKQNEQPDNAEMQHKISDKQSPADTDKAGLNEDQRKSMTINGAVERESVGEFGTDEDRKRKEKKQ